MPPERSDLLVQTERGLYCPPADAYIDPWRPVAKALITHAHSDHARSGMGSYVCTERTLPVLRHRLGADIKARAVAYGKPFSVRGVRFTFFPAGHIPGSAQLRVQHGGRTWVVTGDYKTRPDGISEPFEPVACDTLITESTFGLPVYRWPDERQTLAEIRQWRERCRAEGRTALLSCYSLGKAQRLLHLLGREDDRVLVHPVIAPVNRLLREAGVDLPEAAELTTELKARDLRDALVLAPPGAIGSSLEKRLANPSLGIASGWMMLRGPRRRQAADGGFALSDHADWPGLLDAVRASGASRVIVTHGFTQAFSRYLGELGYEAGEMRTRFGEGGDDTEPVPASVPEP